jgi:hypothetical protein
MPFLNGKTAGILWCPPWRLEITRLLAEWNNEYLAAT